MAGWLPLAVLAGGTALGVAFGVFAVASVLEGEGRAARISAAGAGLCGLSCLAAVLLGGAMMTALGLVLTALGVAAAAALAVPSGRLPEPGGRASARVDERTIMFARARLEPGSPRFEAYYREHPEHRASDDRTRELPGLLSSAAALFDPEAFAAAEASFALTDALREAVGGIPAGGCATGPPDRLTATVRELPLGRGAREVGV